MRDVIEVLYEITLAVPHIGPLPEGWNRLDSVQKCLQEIYRVCMDTVLFVVLYLEVSSSVSSHMSFLEGNLILLQIPKILNPADNIDPHQYISGSANVMAIAKTLSEKEFPIFETDTPTREVAPARMPSVLDYTSQHPADRRARWAFLRYINDGAFGTVSVVREQFSKKVFACKTMKFTINTSALFEDARRSRHEKVVQNEVEIMQKLRQHCHIVSIYFYAKEYPKDYDREAPSLSIFMLPIADMNLHTYLVDAENHGYPISTSKRLRKWTGCLINALAFAHQKGIRHKDIKPQNVLVKGSQVYLTDFGLAVDFLEADVSYTSNSFAGTEYYRAPESGEGEPHGRKGDVFSMGCVFSEMLTVSLDVSLADFKECRNHVRNSSAYHRNLREVQSWLHWLSENSQESEAHFLAEIISNMLREEPEDRSDASSILEKFREQKNLQCHCQEDGE
jgi:hypothetical protein